MKSATIEDVKKAQVQGYLEEDVMYLFGTRFVHGKRAPQTLNWFLQRHTGIPTALLAETADGEIIDIDIRHICFADKGPTQQPKKPRRKPTPGSKPETLLPMSSDVKLKVGDKVVLSDGTRTSVKRIDDFEDGVPYLMHNHLWYKGNGNLLGMDIEYITHKILPWTPPAPAYKPEDVAFNKAVKCAEEFAFDKGYWVPFIATAQTGCPVWAEDVEVNILFNVSNQDVMLGKSFGKHLRWSSTPQTACDVVAYRKAQQ